MHISRSIAAASVLAAALTFSPPQALPSNATEQEYWAELDERDWSAAIGAAQRLVEAARAAEARPLALAEALSMLGNAQFGASDYVNAEAAYAEALALVEQHSSMMSRNLLDPLSGLGYTLAASGRHAAAAPYLEQAVRIAHRNLGLFDPAQQGLLRQLAASLTRVGRIEEAEQHVKYLLRVAERAYGSTDPRIVPTLVQVGEWQSDAGRFADARITYRRAIELVSRKLGKKHMNAVAPLLGLARTYTQELYYSTLGVRTERPRTPTGADGRTAEPQVINPRYLDSEGEAALDRALAIVEAQSKPPRDAYIEVLVQSGDWRQIKHQPEEALELYRRAAALMAAENERAEEAKAGPLSVPVRVYYPTPWLATRNLRTPAEMLEQTFVEVEFTVTRSGDVVDARVVDENGTSRQAAETLEAIRAARFRPRFEDGEPVETTAVTQREIFRVRKSSADS